MVLFKMMITLQEVVTESQVQNVKANILPCGLPNVSLEGRNSAASPWS